MNTKNNAKFAFYYMLSLVALLFMTLSAGIVVFQIINKEIIDLVNPLNGNFSQGPLKFAISALLVSTPIYYCMMHLIQKNLYTGEMDKDSGIRKWLTYLILFVATVVVVGWIINLLISFLDGELSLKVILKFMTILVISGAVFTFYLYDLRRKEFKGIKDKVVKIYFIASLICIIIIFILGVFFVESPAKTRQRKIDQRILDNFNMIDGAINNYYLENKKIPQNFGELNNSNYYIDDNFLIDPNTRREYEYKIAGENSYELCATFNLPSKDSDGEYQYYSTIWPHEKGYQCLKKTVSVLNEKMPTPIR